MASSSGEELVSGSLRQALSFPLRRLPRTTRLVGTLGTIALVLASGLLPVLCPFKLITGLDCPFCGGSRMLGALAQGDVARALDLNAFAFLVVLPLAAVVLVAMAAQELGRIDRYWPSGLTGRVLTCVLVASILVWTVVRNLPFEPFSALRA
jgi:hypothetical protein